MQQKTEEKMKQCTRCERSKELTEFYTMKRGWHRAVCKHCWNLWGQYYYYGRKFDCIKAMEILDKLNDLVYIPLKEVKAPAPRVNVWEWVKRILFIKSN